MRCATAGLSLLCFIFCLSCSAPPDKEINEAAQAIEAARAAGAEQYGPADYKAALDALQKSRDAVAQHDYRQALSYALDSREQAESALQTAGEQKALLRAEVEKGVRETEALLSRAEAKLKAAESVRSRRRALADERRVIDSARSSVQEARTALEREDYPAAREHLRGIGERVQAAIDRIDQSMRPRTQPTRR